LGTTSIASVAITDASQPAFPGCSPRLNVDERQREEKAMPSLQGRTNTALIVIDVQNAVVANGYRRDAVVATIDALVQRARAEDVAVIWVQHASDELVEGTDGWRYVPELQQLPSEPLVHKRYGDSFEDTSLETELAQRGIGRLIVTGAQTDACIRSTLHGAFTRGYDTTLVSDAHTTDDFSEYGLPPADKVIAHTNMYWSWQTAPGRTAAVIEAAHVSFGLTAPTL
jgi:isochorismate hydrolase